MGDSTAHTVAMGDRGRFVVPAAVRERHGWHAGQDLVVELLQDRRAEARREST